MNICSMYTLYVVDFSTPFRIFAQIQERTSNILRRTTHTHTHTYKILFTLAPRVSGIANSHEPQRWKESETRWYVTSRYFLFCQKRRAFFIRLVIFAKSVTRGRCKIGEIGYGAASSRSVNEENWRKSA